MPKWQHTYHTNVNPEQKHHLSLKTETIVETKATPSSVNPTALCQTISELPKTAHYYHIEKFGSSSLGGTMAKYGGFNRTYLSENVITQSDCGFTFVRLGFIMQNHPWK